MFQFYRLKKLSFFISEKTIHALRKVIQLIQIDQPVF